MYVCVRQGTNIAAGKCRGVVIGTGLNTEIGTFVYSFTTQRLLNQYTILRIHETTEMRHVVHYTDRERVDKGTGSTLALSAPPLLI